MTAWRVLGDDGERDPLRNLARDEALARIVAADPAARTPVLRLWRDGPCVVVGRSQLAWAEVDLAAAAALDAPVLRRFTGGGTVWHDEGNLNVSVVVRPGQRPFRDEPALRLVPAVYRIVLEPLAVAIRALGVGTAHATDREVVAGGGKLSGVAAWIGGSALLVHATLLVDADLAALRAVCAGPGAPDDPRWQRTRSRHAAVTSLARELGSAPEPAAVDAAVVAAFVTTFVGGSASGYVTVPGAPVDGSPAASSGILAGGWSDAEVTATERLLHERYADPAWHAVEPTPTLLPGPAAAGGGTAVSAGSGRRSRRRPS